VSNKIIFAAVLGLLSGAAVASDAPRWSVGADVGSTTVPGDSGRFASGGAFAGFQASQAFGVEASYRRLAWLEYQDRAYAADTKLHQLALSATAAIALRPGARIYGRLGINHLAARFKDSDGYRAGALDNTILAGVGVECRLSARLSARLEVQKPSAELTNVHAGLAVHF
jgi:opacity protein-like surface antigen